MTIHTSSTYDRQMMNETAPIEGASQELVDVLQKIVQNTGALLAVNNCSVALLDDGGTTLVTLAALNKEGHKPRHTRFQKSEGVAGWVAEHREALIINDVSLDPRFKRLGRIPVGSMVCVPLLIDKEVFIGTLTVSSPAKDAFDARKLHMLTIFADQAVLAISNARQVEIAQRQANQLEMLMNLSQGITTRLEAESLYRTILVNVQRLVPSQRVNIYHYSERTQELHPVAEVATTEAAEVSAADVKVGEVQGEVVNIHSSGSLIAWAAMHKHPMLRSPVPFSRHLSSVGNNATHVPPVMASSNSPEQNMPPAPEEGTALAELAAPLVSKDILYGVLTLQRPAAYTSEELRLVRNLSNMAAAALENVELFHRVRADQEQWRAIWSASSDGIALVGHNTCFLEANPAFGQIFGIDPQQVVGMECLELFGCYDVSGYDESAGGDASPGRGELAGRDKSPGLDKSSPYCGEICMIQRALQEQDALPYIEVDLSIKGASRSIGLSVTPVSSTDQPFCLVIARDMTAIRDVTRMKANFLSMITHELRSPINAINGYIDLTLTGVAGDLNAQQREFIQRARSGSEHLYALVEDLLLVSRADSGQLRLNRSILKLQELVANSVEEMELTAADSHISIHVAIPGDFPQLYADGVRLQQVLRNLISNAIRFTPPGGSVTIAAQIIDAAPTTSNEEAQQVVAVEVRDTGCGIVPEHRERIFERFYQITQGNAGRSGGQGLGLAIVKMIVELHGGQVTVESVPGEGSTFTFTLPGLLS